MNSTKTKSSDNGLPKQPPGPHVPCGVVGFGISPSQTGNYQRRLEWGAPRPRVSPPRQAGRPICGGLRPLRELKRRREKKRRRDAGRPAVTPLTVGNARTVYGRLGAPGPPRQRRRRSPPTYRPAKVNKASTCAAHLPGAAAPRPLNPGEPDRVRPGQRDRTGEQRRQRRRADAGQARAASSTGVVSAAPEVLGAVASLPDWGRPTVCPDILASVEWGSRGLHKEAVAGWLQSRNHTRLSLPPPRPGSPPNSPT
ncbi:hypothetical protein P7K49_030392 [Saguinus oedipus]|uniref:Uncharacterized protein n=1 Tax=Saguinus oedipus TaxID=9490 RepID=A0ABQ9U218_SAGOE|nr:hypothetical protein P7K49_030392 [Saguinus oedipus]